MELTSTEAIMAAMKGEPVYVAQNIRNLTIGELLELDNQGAFYFKKGDEMKSPPKEKVKKPIDKGKVLALKKAGWTGKAIAEEMGCSEASVSSIISQSNKGEQS